MASDDQPVLRLAVISTPRSGNTWVRGLLASLYDLEELSIHKPEDLDWENLPRRCVIQIHWPPWPRFTARLERLGIWVVAVARHPLDSLLSWLNHSFYVHLEGFCHGSGVCKECTIVGVLPRSETFQSYVTGEYGQMFLGYTPAWWGRQGVLRVRYEELVADPTKALAQLVSQLDEPLHATLESVVAASTIKRMKESHDVWQFHYWQGQPGLWRLMLPAAEARTIAAAVPEPFKVLGYSCDPDESLDPAAADLNWQRLQLASTREHLEHLHKKNRKTLKDLAAVQHELERAQEAIVEEQGLRVEAQNERDASLLDPDAFNERLAVLVENVAGAHQSLGYERAAHEETQRLLVATIGQLDAIQNQPPFSRRVVSRVLRVVSGTGRLEAPHAADPAALALTHDQRARTQTNRADPAHGPRGNHSQHADAAINAQAEV